MSSQFWLAATSYVVVTFVIAAGWHLALFKDVYARLGAFTRPRPIIPLGILSMVLQAGVVAYLYLVQFIVVGIVIGPVHESGPTRAG